MSDLTDVQKFMDEQRPTMVFEKVQLAVCSMSNDASSAYWITTKARHLQVDSIGNTFVPAENLHLN